MTFEEFLSKAWNDHATQCQQVAERLPNALSLIHTNEQIPPLANIITHVFGEHLGSWDEGVALLAKLKELPLFDSKSQSGQALVRATAILQLAGGKLQDVNDLSPSDQVQVFAVTASILNGRKNPEKAQEYFRQAVSKAQIGLDKADPANRALAVAANNLACALEEKLQRTKSETELMILAAQTARKFWAIAGSWLQIERAEYRLVQTFLQAKEFVKAHEHAQTCLQIVQENKAPALEFFFAYEALAMAERARENVVEVQKAIALMKEYFAQLSDEDQKWCQPSLQKLTN